MAIYDQLHYTIHLTDPVLVAQLQAKKFYFFTPILGTTYDSPATSAIKYGAPLIDPNGQPNAALPFNSPSITSPWFNTTSAAQYPRNVQGGSSHSGGFLGIGGTTHIWSWVGTFEYSPAFGASPITGENLQPMPVRRFLDGAEVETTTIFGEGGAGGSSPVVCRAASRHLQGFGYKFDNVNATRTHTPIENGHAATASGWDRIYFRVNIYGNAPSPMWFCSGATSAAAGAEIGILPNGALTGTNIGNLGTRNLLATSPVIPLRKWQKLDILWTYSGTVPVLQVFLNNVKIMDCGAQILVLANGLAQAQNCQSVTLGDAAGNGKHLSIDYDDWIEADLPSVGSALGVYPAYDWNYGSRVALVGARGFASDNNALWVTDWRAARQRPLGGSSTSQLTTSTALARLSVTTDAIDEVDSVASAKGIAAFLVALVSTRGTTSGQLGYRILPGAAVMAAIVQGVALAANQVLYSPAGVSTPTKLAGLELIHDKGNDASAATVKSLFAVAEVIGIFGTEDIPVATNAALTLPAPPASIGIHNAPYPRSPWAKGGGQAPTQPYTIIGGTYVGTGTLIDLPFKVPIHFLWIRPVTGGTGGIEWFSSLNAAHLAGGQSYEPDAPVEVLTDPAFAPGVAVDTQQTQSLVRIVGNGADKNAAGVVYAYIAVSDPGQRFLAAGAFKTYATAVDVVETLDVGTFNPDSVFAMIEAPGVTATVKLYFKGIGSGAANLSGLTTAEIAGLSKAAGSLTIKAPLANLATAAQIAYLALRKDDGSKDVGLPGVMWLTSYVGDGSASRTINFAPASGLRPQWALVVGHNGTTVQRDHTHTGTTSTTFPATANAATGITGGGTDSLSVGSLLNTNGVTFDVLVFPGDNNAVNGGFSGPVTVVPVDPIPPPGGAGTPYDTTLAVPTDFTPADAPVAVVEPGGDSTDFGDQCVVASTKIINQALSHIGITKQIGNVTTEQSDEAMAARLHFSDDLSAVLRDYPWPFATRYATLVLVAGSQTTPVNGDWVYSFRAPANMMAARRLVNPNGLRRTFDPCPPDFRVGSDATGQLIYLNQLAVIDGALADPQLEYTTRPTCAASSGDALFREALAYRHAASLALPLARDEKKATFCLQVYQSILVRAKLAAANEEQKDPPGEAEWLTGRN